MVTTVGGTEMVSCSWCQKMRAKANMVTDPEGKRHYCNERERRLGERKYQGHQDPRRRRRQS